MVQGWFGSDAPLGQDLAVADLMVHPAGSATLPSLLLPEQPQGPTILRPLIVEPPEMITSRILLQLSKQVCPHGFPLAAQGESMQKGCSQPAGPSHQEKLLHPTAGYKGRKLS